MLGRTLGHYKVVEQLGSGGMGVVFVAEDIRLRRRVALKVLPPEMARSTDRRARFEKEARAVAALSHPNVLAIHDFDDEDGVCFAVMELLEGETLAERLRAGPLSTEKAVDYARQIADGLSAAHDRGIVHRDLKPANIFVTRNGPVKILDFGLAQWHEPPVLTGEDADEDSATVERPTAPGTVLGTPGYMSPEQVRGRPSDHRTDIFSFGAVLYEMLTGRRAFERESAADAMSAILNEDPFAFHDGEIEIPLSFRRLLSRCLDKDPAGRFQSARDLGFALGALSDVTPPHRSRKDVPPIRTPAWLRWAILAMLATAALTWVADGIWERRSGGAWARNEGLPELMRLIDEGDNRAAFEIAERIEDNLPGDPLLADLWQRFSTSISISTEPEGAEVLIKPYADLDGEWQEYGTTPLEAFRLPFEPHRLEIRKEGYLTVEGAFRTRNLTLVYGLDRVSELPPDMVRIRSRERTLDIPGLEQLDPVGVPGFLIDKYEVTNRKYKEFVDAGGYEDEAYWTQPFVKEGREIPRERAMAEFVDVAGRSGPATWELGDYPRGEDDYPVRGISWYEASAYAEWAGKSLPTIHHWNYAASTFLSAYIVPLSNMGTTGPDAVGSHPGISAFGMYDMAGNVREWCWNSDADYGRYILGGGWDDHAYSFNDAYAQDPFDRSSTNGFRTASYVDSPADVVALLEPVRRPFRDFYREETVSDEIFSVYKNQFTYDRTPLNAEIVSTDETGDDFTMVKVAFDAAYGSERMAAYLFLPKSATPPYQTIVFYPGSTALTTRSSETAWSLRVPVFDFMMKSGRAVMLPIYKSTYERGDGLVSDYPEPTSWWKDHVIQWGKDLRRSMDYLETRDDIDTAKLAYYGVSWGGEIASVMLAIENRFEVAILYVAGLGFQEPFPEVDPFHYVSRVEIPVLMLNGRYDYYFPYETSQKPMFELLGTPDAHKRQVVYETGHNVPRKELVRESLDWLDRYLGPVE